MNILITGISRGIGYGLANYYLKNHNLYAIGRKNPFGKKVKFYKLDLSAIEKIKEAIDALEIKNLDLAILNAGVLGEIKDMKEWSVKELEDIFKINVWANKILIDYISSFTKKIVVISSGAGVNGNKGWGGYSLSKCAVNMMVKIYSQEIDSKIYALAPGVIETDMVKSVISFDKSKYPSLKRVEEGMVKLEDGIERVVKTIEKLDEFESGSYVDVRTI